MVAKSASAIAIVLPLHRLAERPEERHRSPPAIRSHIANAHRGRAVLQDDQIDAAAPDERRDRDRPRHRHDDSAQRHDQAEPEREIAENRQPLRRIAGRQLPVLPHLGDVAVPAPRLPDPHDEQERRYREERQQRRRGEAQARQVEAGRHQPLRTLRAVRPASSASCRSSGSIGTIILNFFASLSSGGAPATPCGVTPA